MVSTFAVAHLPSPRPFKTSKAREKQIEAGANQKQYLPQRLHLLHQRDIEARDPPTGPEMSPTPPAIPSNKPSTLATQRAMEDGYRKYTGSPPFPPPDRPLPAPPSQLPDAVYQLFPKPPTNHLRRKVLKFGHLRLSRVPLPNPAKKCPGITDFEVDRHHSTVHRSTLDLPSAQARPSLNPVAYLTSLVLQRQDLDAQLATLEGLLSQQNSHTSKTLTEKSTSRGPFNGRLAGILSPSVVSLNGSNYSTRPSYSKQLAGFFGDKPFELQGSSQPAPSKPQHQERTSPLSTKDSQSPKKRLAEVEEDYQDTKLKLAEVELEIELAYMNADLRGAKTYT